MNSLQVLDNQHPSPLSIEDRVNAELAQISLLNEMELREDVKSELGQLSLSLKAATEAARKKVRAYNADSAEGETPHRAPVDESIHAMEAASAEFIKAVREYSQDILDLIVSTFSDYPFVKDEVSGKSENLFPMDEALFQLILAVKYPVLKALVPHLNGMNPGELSVNEEQAFTNIENILIEGAQTADTKARDIIRQNLLVKFEAEEKDQKAKKAMAGLSEKIDRFTPYFTSINLGSKNLEAFLKGPQMEAFVVSALAAFSDLSGVRFKKGHSETVRQACQNIVPMPAAVQKFRNARAQNLLYRDSADTSLGNQKCVEAASEMAEAKREFLADLLKQLIAVFTELTRVAALEGEGQDEAMLDTNRNRVSEEIEIRLSKTIHEGFVAAIRDIQPLDPDGVAARVEAALAALDGRLAAVPSQQAIATAITTALSPRSDAPSQPAVDVDAIANSLRSSLLESLLDFLADCRDLGQAESAIAEYLTHAGIDVYLAQDIAHTLLSPFRRAEERPNPVPVKYVSAPSHSGLSRWTVMGMTTAIAAAGVVIGALTENRYDLVPDGSKTSELVGTVGEEAGSDQLQVSSSVWRKYTGDFPENPNDTAWVRSLAGSGKSLPSDDFGALIVECKGYDVRQSSYHVPMQSVDADGDIWTVSGQHVTGFKPLASGDTLPVLCAKVEDGIFVAQLTPEVAQ